MGMPIRTKRTIFYFKLNVIVEIRLLAKFDYCTITLQILSFPDEFVYLSKFSIALIHRAEFIERVHVS